MVESVCSREKGNLGIPLKLYNQRLRYDKKHRFIYCENFKIGSTTWAAHLLRLKVGLISDFFSGFIK